MFERPFAAPEPSHITSPTKEVRTSHYDYNFDEKDYKSKTESRRNFKASDTQLVYIIGRFNLSNHQTVITIFSLCLEPINAPCPCTIHHSRKRSLFEGY